MAHAGPDALALLTDLLDALRALPDLTERKPGIFYRKAEAFLHFHGAPGAIDADLREAPRAAFTRLPVNTKSERQIVLRRAAKAVRP